jgi:transposase
MENVLFSDETQIQLFKSYRTLVRRPRNQRYNPRYIITQVNRCPSIMIWGGITAQGNAGIHIVPQGMHLNAVNYVQILENNLQLWFGRHGCQIFQHDGAPCHQAKLVKTWLKDHQIELLEPWPGSSPDLNPIENCWVHLKRLICQSNPTSLKQLESDILNAWRLHITPEYCQSLIDSMPRRILAVIKARGKHTKY